MKAIRHLFPIVLISLMFSSCLLRSFNPFYTEQDVVFDSIFIGEWFDQDSCYWEITQRKVTKGWFSREDSLVNSYRVKFTTDEEVSYLEVHQFELHGEKYLDFFPIMDEHFAGEFYSLHLVATHSLAKIRVKDENNIEINWFNEAWLVKQIKENKIKMPHQVVESYKDEKSYILTSETEELQKFILKYGQDPKATKCDKSDGICAILKRRS